ncbi:MAG TPA: helix-turn-helix transcriptional regulator [Candidatus Sulfotelmatobacter sp.]|nr:helix-turn-helix transcriptional regulator [Candidatus Sulfotelmatobacter sp.]
MAYKANTIEELLAIMKRVQGGKSLTEFAAELDLSKQYLSNVYNRHKEPSERLLEKLGFTRQTAYVPAPVPPASAPGKQKQTEKHKDKEKENEKERKK